MQDIGELRRRNHIDVAAARNRGIVVTNTPGAVTDATADIARVPIHMTARRAAEDDRLVRQGNWQKGWQPTEMPGLHVTGKTLGVIGMGRVGTAIARRCHLGFRMKVDFFNRSKVEGINFPAEQMESAEEVMSAADFAAVAVPACPQLGTW